MLIRASDIIKLIQKTYIKHKLLQRDERLYKSPRSCGCDLDVLAQQFGSLLIVHSVGSCPLHLPSATRSHPLGPL